MADLPEWARRSCEHCGASVAYVQTPRKSKGNPVELLIDFTPADGQAGTVPVQLSGKTLYGDAVAKHLAAAMRAGGRNLHTIHKETCVKRNTNHRV